MHVKPHATINSSQVNEKKTKSKNKNKCENDTGEMHSKKILKFGLLVAVLATTDYEFNIYHINTAKSFTGT